MDALEGQTARTQQSGLPFIVQEFIEGENLGKIIRDEGPLPPVAAVQVLMDIGEGLQHVHSSGYQHLDVKPQNILISRKGNAILTDFGLAVSDDEKWNAGSRGTVPYMAPEQLKSESGQYDGRTDIWSLGVVFYEMLTKHLPFDGGSSRNQLGNLSHAILSVEPKPPSQWQPELPQALDRICFRCLRKRVDERYQSTSELLTDAKRFINSSKIPSADDYEEPLLSEALEKRRNFMVVGCLFVALAVTGLILVAVGFKPKRITDALSEIVKFFRGPRRR